VNSFSQSDTTKSKVIDNEISVTKSTSQLKSNTANSKVTPNNPNLNFNNELNVDAVNKNLKNYTSTNNPNFLMENLPEDNDIIGKKYWKGEDITHKRLGSTYSLGTSNSATKTVRVVCRDYSYVDGDIIKIYINEQPLKNNVVLKGGNYMVYLELNEGYNRIDFQALNQGLSGPNTAELKLYDANDNLISSNEWNLLTGQTATLGVIYK
ncbi:MAG: hypothetical protein IZT56_11170, partial [Bacteroidetes bacterium]|nr:hypothetical protein [Bacteroidota bacterium]